MIMDTENLCHSFLKGGDLIAESNLHKQIDHDHCQSTTTCFCGSHAESDEINGTRFCNGNYAHGQNLTGVLHGDTAGTADGSPTLKYDSVAEGSAALHRELPRFEGSSDTPQRYLRRQRDRTLQGLINMYKPQEYSEDNDDDDSDWEPFSEPVFRKKWFCINCTVPNFDDVSYCDVCGEYRESDIGSEVINRCQGSLVTKSRTVVGFDERMLLHSEVEMKSHPHPERPDRLRAIAASLATADIFPGKCFSIPAREITHEELGMVHSQEHVNSIDSTSCMLSSYFTPDTYANEYSACAARLAAGLCADLASTIMSGQAQNGFALVRPPGHHAGIKQAMGFCLHNNAAVAAFAAQAAGASKVLIVDWDVHHGNGTQEIFEGNRSVLYISLHRHEDGRFYPGTGAVNEVGSGGAEGYTVNVPWKCGGVGDNDYIFAFRHIVLPIALQFAPNITIISAGFDAARGDPLGCCDVTPAGFAQMTHMLSDLSQGKLLAILEGGYNLRSISSSTTAVIKVLLGEGPGCAMYDAVPSKAGLRSVLEVMEIQTKFWSVLEASYIRLRSQWESSYHQSKKKRIKKRRRIMGGPIWWKWGRKRLMYNIFFG